MMEECANKPVRNWAPWLLLGWTLIIFVLGVAGFETLRRSNDATRAKTDQYHATFSQVQQLMSRTDAQDEHLNSVHQALQRSTKEWADLTATVKHLDAVGPDSWLLLEAAHFIRLGTDYMVTAPDPVLTIQTLQLAQSRLKEIQKTDVQLLMLKVSQALSSLSQLPTNDMQQHWATLGHIQQSLDHAPFIIKLTQVPVESETRHASTQGLPQWRVTLNQIWDELKQFLRIRRVSDADLPWLSMSEQSLIRERAQWLVLQAEWSLVHQNTEAYRQSLAHLETLLHRYFDPDSADTQKLLADCGRLMKANLTIHWPDLSELSTAAQIAIERQGFQAAEEHPVASVQEEGA
ncbi:MAG: uroporphyrinogen-III C-methyltransferase [Pseudomonadota bacterium]